MAGRRATGRWSPTRRACSRCPRASATRSSRSRASRRSRAASRRRRTPTAPPPSCATAATAACSSTTTRSAAASRTRCRAIPGFVYDPAAGGGTTTIEVDKDGNRVREYVSLAGTHNNCAGGQTPWDTWLTCEETESAHRQSQAPRLRLRGRPVRPATPTATRSRSRRSAATRTRRSSSTRDTGAIYLTEDAGNPNGLLYRWTPPRRALPLRQAARCGARRRRRHARGDARRSRATARTSPTSRSRPQPGTTLPRRLGRGARPRRDHDSRRASSSADAQITRSRKLEGHVVGRRRRVLRLLVRALRPTAAPPSTTARSGSSTRAAPRSS